MREYKIGESIVFRDGLGDGWVAHGKIENINGNGTLLVGNRNIVWYELPATDVFSADTLPVLIAAAENDQHSVRLDLIDVCPHYQTAFYCNKSGMQNAIDNIKQAIAAVESTERELALLREAKRLLEEKNNE